jgi:hypothetical protein
LEERKEGEGRGGEDEKNRTQKSGKAQAQLWDVNRLVGGGLVLVGRMAAAAALICSQEKGVNDGQIEGGKRVKWVHTDD